MTEVDLYYIVSSRVSAPPQNIDLPLFCLPPPSPLKKKKKILNLSDSPNLYEQPPLWNVPLCKAKKSFEETKDFISNNKSRAHLNIEIWIELQNLKIKGELGFF